MLQCKHKLDQLNYFIAQVKAGLMKVMHAEIGVGLMPVITDIGSRTPCKWNDETIFYNEYINPNSTEARIIFINPSSIKSLLVEKHLLSTICHWTTCICRQLFDDNTAS